MSFKHYFVCFVLVLRATSECWGQIISGPLVEGKFSKDLLTENFDSISPVWPVTSNADNLLLIQNGEMILHRKNETSPLAVVGSYEFNNELNAYRLITSVRLTKSDDEGSIGLIFMAQNGGAGGLVFEINRMQQYRLKQISGAVYKFISGDARTNGWVKNNLVKPADWNIIEIRTADRKYDILLNNRYLLSFTSMEYRNGGIGFLAGPSSKAAVDFLYIFKSEEIKSGSQHIIDSDSSTDQDIVMLTESVVRLKAEVNRLNTENEELRKLLKLQQEEATEFRLDSEQQSGEIASLQRTVISLRNTNDSLIIENQKLLKYKTAVEGSSQGEVLIDLSKSLKSAKEKNEELQKEINTLKEELQRLKAPGNN